MDRLTREQIEQWRTALCDPDEFHAQALSELNALCDLALSALSQEAVRDEAFEEAKEAAKAAHWHAHEPLPSCLASIEALKREPNAAARAGQRNDSAPSHEGHAAGPAPAAPDVASMVKRIEFIRSYASAHIAAEDQNAMRDACALLAKLGQGWIPVSERLPDTTREVELAVRGRDGEIYRAFGYFKNDWRTSVYDPGGTVIAWHDLMPLPPSTGASDE